MDINKYFGGKVAEVRKKRNMSQEELANLAEIDRTYLPSVEKGTRKVSLTVADKIAKALGTTLPKLLEGYKN